MNNDTRYSTVCMHTYCTVQIATYQVHVQYYYTWYLVVYEYNKLVNYSELQ